MHVKVFFVVTSEGGFTLQPPKPQYTGWPYTFRPVLNHHFLIVWLILVSLYV